MYASESGAEATPFRGRKRARAFFLLVLEGIRMVK